MHRIFVGVDKRQPIAYHVLISSIQRRSSEPVCFIPLMIEQLPIKRRGLTDFTFSRYLAPYLCGFEGRSLFIDSDMLVLGDIAELFRYEFEGDVAVVPFADPFAFERPSVMLFNNEQCINLTPEYIEAGAPQSFEWADKVSELPPEWNHLVGYSEPQKAKLVHYTQGVPGYKECRDCEYSEEWHKELEIVNHHQSWLEIMGGSVHAPHVLKRLQEKMQ